MNLGGPEIIMIVVVIVLLFGSTQLPKLARSIGQAQKEFKTGLKEGEDGVASDAGKDADSDNDKSA